MTLNVMQQERNNKTYEIFLKKKNLNLNNPVGLTISLQERHGKGQTPQEQNLQNLKSGKFYRENGHYSLTNQLQEKNQNGTYRV